MSRSIERGAPRLSNPGQQCSISKNPLYEKFKQICPAVTPVGKLLKADGFRKISQLHSAIDLKWFNAKQGGNLPGDPRQRSSSDLGTEPTQVGAVEPDLSTRSDERIPEGKIPLLADSGAYAHPIINTIGGFGRAKDAYRSVGTLNKWPLLEFVYSTMNVRNISGSCPMRGTPAGPLSARSNLKADSP